MIRARRADPWMAFELELREEDSREVSDGWRVKIAETVRQQGALSFYDEEGQLLALGGIVSGPVSVSPWLLCSPAIAGHRREVMRRARAAVRAIRQDAGTRLVYNFIPKDSHANRRFVQALGFVIVPSPREGFDFFFLPHV